MGHKTFFSALMSVKPEDLPEEGRNDIPQWTKGNFKYNWVGIGVLVIPPLHALVGLLLGVPIHLHTLVIMYIWGLITGVVGVTAGYHRLYSHKAYTAGPFMLKLTAFIGAGAFQGSIKWWARLHRIHHKYVDTDLDPYNAKRGFVYSHFGWMIMRQRYDLLGDADVSDLDAHPVVKFQRKNFAQLAVVSGILLPWFTCGLLFDDWVGGLLYCAFLKIFLVHQISFLINSLAHTNWFGAKQNFDVETTPHDSIIFAFTNLGEGYHNYHHAFANDYRNGYKWHMLDITKWYIYLCERLGFCWDLYRIPVQVIARTHKVTRIQQIHVELGRLEHDVEDKAPAVTHVLGVEDVADLVKEGRKLIIVDGYVLDLEQPIELEASATHSAGKIHWLDAHPGGRAFLNAYIGRDATEAVNGGVYKHTHGAHSIMTELRVAHLKHSA